MCALPQHEVGQLARLDGAHRVRHPVRERRVDLVRVRVRLRVRVRVRVRVSVRVRVRVGVRIRVSPNPNPNAPCAGWAPTGCA